MKPDRFTRRSVVQYLGLGGLAALAGCSSATESSPTTTVTPTVHEPASKTRTLTPAATADPGLDDLELDDQFDFWAGAWADEKGAGPTVFSLLEGHLLLDVYGPYESPAAMAMTFVDPAADDWIRRFLDRNGVLVQLTGGVEDGTMALIGERIAPDGTTIPFRATWVPTEDGGVQHTLEKEGDRAGTWTTSFQASYMPNGEVPPYPEPTAEPVPESRTAIADRPPRRQFDFWVGNWAVYSGENQVGESVVQSRLDGNLVLEHWYGSSGSRGMSFNYYNPATEVWTQTWVANNGTWIEMSGGVADGSIQMVGTQVDGFGTATDYRGTFTPSGTDAVQQVLETSPDGGETWLTGFSGRYEPVT